MPKEKTDPQLNCGEIIKKYRKKKRMTKQEMSKALNISANQLINWESNRCEPRASTILQICRLLDIPLNEIYGIPEKLCELSREEGDILEVFRKSSPQVKASIHDLLYAANGIPLSSEIKDSSSLNLYGDNTSSDNFDPFNETSDMALHDSGAYGVSKASYSTLVDNEGVPLTRKRGRPRIHPLPEIDPDNPPVKRGRGRPRIHPLPEIDPNNPPVKRGRGRPRIHMKEES